MVSADVVAKRFVDMQDTAETAPMELLKCLRQWISAGFVNDLLIKILRDDIALQEVCDQSFLHPLGVWKIVLRTSGNSGLELRIHYWDEESRPPLGWSDYLHNHKWNFSSHILFGKFETSIFASDRRGVKLFQKELITSGVGSERVMKTVGVCHLLEVLRTRMSSGDSYFLHASTIHLIEPICQLPAATLMLRGKYLSDFSDTFSFQHESTLSEAKRGTKPISKEKVRAILERTVESLKD